MVGERHADRGKDRVEGRGTPSIDAAGETVAGAKAMKSLKDSREHDFTESEERSPKGGEISGDASEQRSVASVKREEPQCLDGDEEALVKASEVQAGGGEKEEGKHEEKSVKRAAPRSTAILVSSPRAQRCVRWCENMLFFFFSVRSRTCVCFS